MSFNIREAIPEDVPILLEMVRELARFERLEHEVEATGESLRESLFGPHPVAGALVASVGTQTAGYAIFYFTFSSFVGRGGIWLDDLYVRPQFREQGLGGQLIQAVANIGVVRNCGRFEWSALNWNEKAIQFYRKLGARTLDDWVMLRMNSQEMRALAESRQSRDPRA
jgi:GNAT superfamily N-acetyltransferase